MKKYLLLACLILSSVTLMAQPPGRKGMKEKIKTLKIAFITEKLDLTSSEAEKFWPIYNAFDSSFMKLKHESMRSLKENLNKEIETLTEKEAASNLNELTAIEDQLTQLKQGFRSQLEGVISNKKILLLKIAEDGFNRRMMDKLRRQPKQKRR